VLVILSAGLGWVIDAVKHAKDAVELIGEQLAGCSDCPLVVAADPSSPGLFTLQLDRPLDQAKLYRLKSGVLFSLPSARAALLGATAPPPLNKPIELTAVAPEQAVKYLSSGNMQSVLDPLVLSRVVPVTTWPAALLNAVQNRLLRQFSTIDYTDCKQITQFDSAEQVISPMDTDARLPQASELSLLRLALGCVQ